MNRENQERGQTLESLRAIMLEWERANEALSYSRSRLKRMSKHTLNILEADRQTISRELHDSIGASLSAIKFSLEEKELLLGTSGGEVDISLAPEIRILLETIKETKRISAHLRPTILDDLGLLATLEWYVRQFQAVHNEVSIRYAVDVQEADVPDPMKINIYRIVQESLSNAGKHANPSTVFLNLGFCDGGRSLFLSIEDDGQGFDAESLETDRDPLSGYGLTAMRERCEIFGGTFHIESESGKGTRINAILPVDLVIS